MHSDDREAVDLAEYMVGSEQTWQKYLDYSWAASTDVVEVSRRTYRQWRPLYSNRRR
jgi:hypothetical protein